VLDQYGNWPGKKNKWEKEGNLLEYFIDGIHLL